MAGVQKPWLKFKEKAEASAHNTTVPDDFIIDAEARYEGTVLDYFKWSGYGFVKPKQPEIVGAPEVFLHWSNIQSDDRFPYVNKDMEVEFGLMKSKDKKSGKTGLRAKHLTLPGGKNVALQDEVDAAKKTFVGGQHLRYHGTLKWYEPAQGCGKVVLEEGYVTPEPVPKALDVFEHEINAGGKRPQKMGNVQVEFGIIKNKSGKYVAYNMSMMGGLPMTPDNVEHREIMGEQLYTGKITSWNWSQGWGLVTPDLFDMLPAVAQEKMNASVEAAIKKGKKEPTKSLYFKKADLKFGFKATQGAAVTFQLYSDDKGVGACSVNPSEEQN